MALPIWHAVTAYIAGTRVTPVAPDGTVWYVQTAGTSGAAQPTWPVVQPWTVVDGTVTWGRATAFRQNMVDAIYAQLGLFITANPTLLRQRHYARPKSASNSNKPYAFIGSRPETIVTGNSIRQREGGFEVIVVDEVPDNEEALTRMDILMDALIDWFTFTYHMAGAPTISAATATGQISEEELGQGLYAEVLTITGAIAEGRQ